MGGFFLANAASAVIDIMVETGDATNERIAWQVEWVARRLTEIAAEIRDGA